MKANCFIIPLREPVARFQSGWRKAVEEKDNKELADFFHGSADKTKQYTLKTVSEYVKAARDPTHIAHATVMRNYFSSVAHPMSVERGPLGLLGGSNFLVSQLDHLRGVNCEKHEIHFLCVGEHVEEDWDRLMTTFGLESAFVHEHDRSTEAITKNDAANREDTLRGSTMDPAEAEYFRRCLYPWDVDLFEHICTSGAARRFKATHVRMQTIANVENRKASGTPSSPSSPSCTIPPTVKLISTGKAGTKMTAAMLNKAYNSTNGRHRVDSEPFHSVPSITGVAEFIKLVHRNTDELIALHVIRDPIDVALSLFTSGKSWLSLHMTHFRFDGPTNAAKQAKLNSNGPGAVIEEDLFGIQDHVAGWEDAVIPVVKVTVKYEALGDPAVAQKLKDALCLAKLPVPPPSGQNFGGGHNNNHHGESRDEIMAEAGLSERQKAALLSVYGAASSAYSSISDFRVTMPAR
jgi:hypothetical protein